MPREPKVLIINPNTSATVTRCLDIAARRLVGSTVQIETIQVTSGKQALTSEADLVEASGAVAEVACGRPDVDGIIIGAFGDPGLSLARKAVACPVTGIGEAGILESASYGRFSILTLGPQMEQTIRKTVGLLGLTQQLVDLDFLPVGVSAFAFDPGAYFDDIRNYIDEARQRGANAVLLGGGPLAGLETEFSDERIIVQDSLSCAVRAMLREMGLIRPIGLERGRADP